MSGLARVDPESLGWIRSEIDLTLGQAREYLADFEPSRNDGDVTPFRMVANDLHQVVGTLQMMEIDGAAMLAEEVEALADALVEDKIQPESSNTELLNRGLGVLSDYLDQLHKGLPDLPIKQIDVINEFRIARGESPLDPYVLFRPDLDILPPNKNRSKISDDEYKQSALRLRREYQSNLLNWLRTLSKESLGSMASVVDQMSKIAYFSKVAQLWWVVDALMEILADDPSNITVERKKLLGRLDLQIRALGEDGEAALIHESPEQLIRQILFEIGRYQGSLKKADDIRSAFDLDVLLTGELKVDEEELAALPTAGQLLSLREGVKADLERAQEILATCFRAKSADVEALPALTERLDVALSTSEQHGIKPVQELLSELAQLTNAIRNNQPINIEDAALEMASAMLFIDESLRGVHTPDLDWMDEVSAKLERLRAIRINAVSIGDLAGADQAAWSEEALGATEFKQVMAAVAGEIYVDLNKIEEALETYAATHQLDSLESAPRNLQQLQGVLQILGQHRIVELLGMAHECVQQLIDGVLSPERTLIEAIAVAVGTTQAYVQGLEHGRPRNTEVLDRAIRDLEDAVANRELDRIVPAELADEIREHLERWSNDSADYQSLRQLRRSLRRIIYFADKRDYAKLYQISSEMNNLIDIVTDEPALLTEEVRDTLSRSSTKLASLTSEIPASPPSPEAAVQPQAPLSGLQVDILEIFFEEAAECFQVIDEVFPRWKADTANTKALKDLRRQFHTLKGSGRMAEVGQPAELAWVVEDVLNRVIDGKQEANAPVIDLVEGAIDTLKPVLTSQLAGADDIDVDNWGERAQRVLSAVERSEAPAAVGSVAAIEGPSLELQEVDTPVVAESGVEPMIPKDSAGVPDRASDAPPASDRHTGDDAVVEIFIKETLQHVSVLRAALDACKKDAGDCCVTEELLRSLHTLCGSSRSIELVDMADACASVESRLHTVVGSGGMLRASELELLDTLAGACEQVVEQLREAGTLAASTAVDFNHIVERSLALKALRTRAAEGDSARPEDHRGVQARPESVGEAVRDESVLQDFPEEADAMALEDLLQKAEEHSAATKGAASTELERELANIKDVLEADTFAVDEFRDIFCEEATDLLVRINHRLAEWGASGYAAVSAALKRDLHTLKGSARAAGANAVGDLSHNTETLLERVDKLVDVDHGELRKLLEEVHDTLFDTVQCLEKKRTPPEVDGLHQALLDFANDRGANIASGPRPVTGVSETAAREAARTEELDVRDNIAAPAQAATPAPSSGRDPQAPAPGAERAAPLERVRVTASMLDELFNFAGEASITRAQMTEQLAGLKFNLNELRSNVVRFSDQLRELEIQAETQIHSRVQDRRNAGIEDEFDPLEFDRYTALQQLSRSLSESLDDLKTIEGGLAGFAHASESLMQQQALLNTELQGGLMRARMVPFSTLIPRLRHHARQFSRSLGKRVEVQVIGQEVEVDRSVLETMTEAFEHMIRNAVDHGIEAAAQRKSAGKPELGTIRIECKQEGNEVVIRFSDDGGGLDVEKIRRQAEKLRLTAQDSSLTEQDLIQLIVMPGFSTADAVTHVSGRGVGLDVVHSAIRRLGGNISVESVASAGATFVIRLPVTLSVTHALFVRCGTQSFAIPLGIVQRVLKVDSEKLAEFRDRPEIIMEGQRFPLMHLSERLGLPSEAEPGRHAPVLLVRMGARDIAVWVDELLGTQEIVVKSIGGHLSSAKGIAGATIRGDGSVVLILDMAELWVAHEVDVNVTRATSGKESAEIAPVIMVVDDSLTVRKVTSRNLNRYGMEVIMARDGIEALEQVRLHRPDLMLVDIEMPRMDGFELTSEIRMSASTRDIPIVIITSRAGAKHKQKAMELGANAYLTKPYQEQELLANIQALLPQFFSEQQSMQAR